MSVVWMPIEPCCIIWEIGRFVMARKQPLQGHDTASIRLLSGCQLATASRLLAILVTA